MSIPNLAGSAGVRPDPRGHRCRSSWISARRFTAREGQRVRFCPRLLLAFLPALTSLDALAQTDRSFVGCGPPNEKHRVIRHTDRPMPEPSPGKSIVFFACEAYETKLGLDGTWVAANRYASYSYVDVEPGVRRFCGVEPRPSGYKESLLLLTAEEGNTYYLVWRKGKLSEISKLEWEALMDKWIRARLRWKKAAKNSGAYVTFERLPADRSK